MSTQKEETRARLFSAARKLLVQRGFHSVKLEDIAEAAGVSRQAVYKSHFASKAELLLALVQHLDVSERIDELTKDYRAATSGRDMLREGLRAMVLIEGRIHDIALAITAAAGSDAGAKAALSDRLAVKRGAVRGAIARLHAEGQLSPHWSIDEAVEIILALLSTDSYELLVVQGGWTPEQLIERASELCEVFLTQPTAARARRKR